MSRSIFNFARIVPVFLFISCSTPSGKVKTTESIADTLEYALVLHGGAGSMNFENLPEPERIQYLGALDSALQLGLGVLEAGGSSLDAVETVIRYMEDNPLFNAGKGAVFTSDGMNELDASVMTGQDMKAGAVAGVTDIRHPISAARAVMEKTEHVLLAGSGASDFAREAGLEIVDPSFFYTEERYESFQRGRLEEKPGTVGCVALDCEGNLCAGTSTGGMANKKHGRIGDTPIIGAGTYAKNETCGVSATGHGEYFIRWSVAHDISALMEYEGLDVGSAARLVVEGKLAAAGGSGGVICLDRSGRAAMVTNTSGMFRAYGNSDGERIVAIFREEGPR